MWLMPSEAFKAHTWRRMTTPTPATLLRTIAVMAALLLQVLAVCFAIYALFFIEEAPEVTAGMFVLAMYLQAAVILIAVMLAWGSDLWRILSRAWNWMYYYFDKYDKMINDRHKPPRSR